MDACGRDVVEGEKGGEERGCRGAGSGLGRWWQMGLLSDHGISGAYLLDSSDRFEILPP